MDIDVICRSDQMLDLDKALETSDDLRTKQNRLSLWESSEPLGKTLDDAILALVAGMERVVQLSERHIDAVNLDHGRQLGTRQAPGFANKIKTQEN